ncbi:MAG: amidohydrolase [Deferribacterota bacterium]|nr:amidohydrolase [Deferribacterota bacterium]
MAEKYSIFATYIYYDDKIIKDKYLNVEDGKIIGISKIPKNDFTIIKREGSAIFPGFINTHTHLPMVLFRGLADDLPLTKWLNNYIWPAESKWLSKEFIKDATTLGACELIRSGTTTVNDMYFFSETIAGVLEESGLRGILGVSVLDLPTKFADNADSYLNTVESLIEKIAKSPSLNVAICPHSLYTVSPKTFKRCISLAEKFDLLLHTHIAETKWEINELEKRYGKTPVELANELGFFDKKSISAHCVHLTKKDIELMGKKNANISHCIESNLKLASGIAPIKELLDAGANITIGTDGAASNNDLDMLTEISTVAKIHKGINLDPTIVSAKEVFNMSTKNAARALSLDNTGILKEGKSADFFILSLKAPHANPIYNILSHLVYSAKSSDITDLFVNGRPLMLNGSIKTIDETKAIEKAKEWSRKIS